MPLSERETDTDSATERSPLVVKNAVPSQNIPFAQRPLIVKLNAALEADTYIFNVISLSTAAVIVGSGFQKQLPEIINVIKWVTLGNMSFAAALGIHKMYYPDSNDLIRHIFQSVLAGSNACVYSLQEHLALVLFGDKKKQVDISDKLFFLGILPFDIIIGLAILFVKLCKYQPSLSCTLPSILKFISFLALLSFNTASTLRPILQYIPAIFGYSDQSYNTQLLIYLVSSLVALSIESLRVIDALPSEYNQYKVIQFLDKESHPRKTINFIMNLASPLNNAIWWGMFLYNNQPADKNSISEAAKYDFIVLGSILVAMMPILAPILGTSIHALFKYLTSLINYCCSSDDQNNYYATDALSNQPYSIQPPAASALTLNGDVENNSLDQAPHRVTPSLVDSSEYRLPSPRHAEPQLSAPPAPSVTVIPEAESLAVKHKDSDKGDYQKILINKSPSTSQLLALHSPIFTPIKSDTAKSIAHAGAGVESSSVRTRSLSL